jgi:hypothetical protein
VPPAFKALFLSRVSFKAYSTPIKMIDIETMDRLLSMLSQEHRDKSETLGKILASWDTMTSRHHGRDKWIQLCRPSDESIYSQWVESTLTPRTLATWAESDSPELYRDWFQQTLHHLLVRGTSGQEIDLTETLFHIYWRKYVCTNLSSPTWYAFNDVSWYSLPEDDVLTYFIAGLIRRYEQFVKDISDKIAAHPELESSGSDLITRIQRILGRLRQTTFKSTLLRECRDRFYEPLEPKLNRDPNLIGSKNGTLEILLSPQPHLRFRKSVADDHLSHGLGVAYKQPSQENLKMLGDVFTTMFPDSGSLLLQVLFDGLMSSTNPIWPIFVGSIDLLNRLLRTFIGTYGIVGSPPKRPILGNHYLMVTLNTEPIKEDRLLNFMEYSGAILFLAPQRPHIRTRVNRIRLIPVAPVSTMIPETQVSHLAGAMLWRLVNEPISRSIHPTIETTTQEFWSGDD